MRLQGTEMETELRHSSVDDVPDSPGYGPITMENLWKLVDSAIEVVRNAQHHLEWGDPAHETLFPVLHALLSVAMYTCSLREAS
jgi:hypothetical protein